MNWSKIIKTLDKYIEDDKRIQEAWEKFGQAIFPDAGYMTVEKPQAQVYVKAICDVVDNDEIKDWLDYYLWEVKHRGLTGLTKTNNGLYHLSNQKDAIRFFKNISKQNERKKNRHNNGKSIWNKKNRNKRNNKGGKQKGLQKMWIPF